MVGAERLQPGDELYERARTQRGFLREKFEFQKRHVNRINSLGFETIAST